MLYINEKDQKIYLKVGEKFVEVNIIKNKKDYTVLPTKNKIEAYGNEGKFKSISLEEAYKIKQDFENSLKDELQ